MPVSYIYALRGPLHSNIFSWRTTLALAWGKRAAVQRVNTNFSPVHGTNLAVSAAMASTLRMCTTISPGSGSHSLRADETKPWLANQSLVSSARRLWQPWTRVGTCAWELNTGHPGLFFLRFIHPSDRDYLGEKRWGWWGWVTITKWVTLE